MKKRVLIVAAHPDDEVLGCFGTVARLIREGYEAYTLILGEGKTSRYSERQNAEEELSTLNSEIMRANEAIGVRKVFIEQFPDNRFDSVALIDIVKVIEQVKQEVEPHIIFTHYEHDLNIDHQITYKALLTATRPMEGESVEAIYSFEILSSTEWNYPLSFSPDTYFSIDDTLDLKKEAMAHYASELRDFPHPRSLKGIELNAQYHGMRVGKEYVEAFKCVRAVK